MSPLQPWPIRARSGVLLGQGARRQGGRARRGGGAAGQRGGATGSGGAAGLQGSGAGRGGVAAYPVQPDDHFVVVVLALLAGGLQGEVQVGPGEARDEEVHHGPQLQEGVVQGGVDEQQTLLAAHTTGDDT